MTANRIVVVMAAVLRVVGCLVAACTPALADGAADELPRSPPLRAEELRVHWKNREKNVYTSFEFLVEGSPLGWGISRDGSGYSAMVRGGPGLSRIGDGAVMFVYATYEVSPQSQRTFGLHASWVFEEVLGIGVGALAETSGRFGGVISAKLLLVGLEAQLRDTAEHGPSGAVYLTLQLPVRRLIAGFDTLRGKKK